MGRIWEEEGGTYCEICEVSSDQSSPGWLGIYIYGMNQYTQLYIGTIFSQCKYIPINQPVQWNVTDEFWSLLRESYTLPETNSSQHVKEITSSSNHPFSGASCWFHADYYLQPANATKEKL